MSVAGFLLFYHKYVLNISVLVKAFTYVQNKKLLVDKRKWRRQKIDHARETPYFISPLISCAR